MLSRMQNKFSAENYPGKEPATIVVGDRWAWKRPDIESIYPYSDYTLKYSLRLHGVTSSEIELSSAAAEFVIEVPAATTAAHPAGRYDFQAYITRNSDSERVMVDSGSIELIQNRDLSTADPRSHARKMLDLIESAIEGSATDQDLDVLATAHGDSSITRNPLKLVPLRDKYRAEVGREIAAERLRKGEGHRGRILTRFV